MPPGTPGVGIDSDSDIDFGGDDVDPFDQVDLAVTAYREAGRWRLEELPEDVESLTEIALELRRYPDDSAALALLSVGEDFFLLVRTYGHETVVLLSDASAATDWPLARSVVDLLGVPVDDDPAPAGDLGILADLGMPAVDLGELVDDEELYPDEQLSDIATTLGFGPAFDELAGLAPA